MKNIPHDIEKYPCRDNSLKNLPAERWAEIPGLEDAFHISNHGRIKSLAREIHYTNGKVIHKKERILMAGIHRQIIITLKILPISFLFH